MMTGHHQSIGLLQRAHEIVDRRQRESPARVDRSHPENWRRRDKILSVRWRLKDKFVGTGPSVLAVSLAHVGSSIQPGLRS